LGGGEKGGTILKVFTFHAHTLLAKLQQRKLESRSSFYCSNAKYFKLFIN